MDTRGHAEAPPSRSAPRLDAPVTARDGARRRLAARVAALQQPAAYPEPSGAIEAIETHMSWVFLTERHAYKLKKPLATRFFDHATREARRRACLREVELNRRLAPDVYLGVVPLSGALVVEGPGPPIDWLVKMRRLPRDRMLDVCIARRTVRGAAIDRLATRLIGFYAAAHREPQSAAAYRSRISWDVEAKRRSLEQPRYGLARDDVRAVTASLRGWLDRHPGLLEARAASVVDGHGDLRPEHVCLEATPVVIDCLEFSRELRAIDPISELSYLALECRRLGAGWIGDQLLATYSQRARDPVPPPLVPFYQGYHALVRAAVAIWHLDDDAIDGADRWRERATSYLRLAQRVA